MKRLASSTARRLIVVAAVFATLSIVSERPAHADLLELKWATEGYFRTRTVLLTNLAPQPRRVSSYPPTGDQIVIPEIRRTSYITSRLRLMPRLSYGNIAHLNMQIDAMDDVLWGDNNGLASAPLFATDATHQHFLGGEEKPSIALKRAWVEFQLPVGQMRVGRMPSHWGMGLLANGGGTGRIDPTSPVGYPPRRHPDHFFANDFGDSHFGSTTDRILFVTKPVTIAKTIAGAKDTESNIIVGYAFDKLSEAPWLPAEPFERRFRPFGQQGFISRGRNDDVDEHVVLAVYNNPDWNRVRYTDEIRAGAYGVIRTAKEGSTNPSALDPGEFCGTFQGEAVPCVDTGSFIWIIDFWYRFRYGPYYSEAEVLYIGGKSFGGVPFPSPNQKKQAAIAGGVWRGGYLTPQWDAILEVGHAGGDDELEDEKLKQRALHPDYNVGLILFPQTLRELSARTFGPPFFSRENPDGATGLMSNGGVINANYIHPKGRFRPGLGDLEVVGALLFAWVDTLATTGTAMFYADDTDSSYLGTEIDVAVKTGFAGKMDFSLEAGYLIFGPALRSVLPNAKNSFTLQTRLAFLW
jgi:hypothetical protein